MDRKELGRTGEELAQAFLTRHGYRILDRNFHTRWGELDIVARERKDVVFVEVKTRTDTDFASPEESVNFTKQEHLRRAAELWLAEKNPQPLPLCRFDVVTVTFKNGAPPLIEHFKEAFV